MSKSFSFLFFVLIYFPAQSQSIFVNQIKFEGNNKTRDKVILRELNFQEGDSVNISQLNSFFDKNKDQVLSTGLFNTAQFNLENYKPDEERADISIKLEENWYVYPVPIFELADRNFNVWWTEQNRDLSRLNYGIRLSHYNLTGNRDPLKIKIQLGFTRKLELRYSYPYLSKDHKWGFATTAFYADNKTIGYKTLNNKTLWHKNENEEILLKRFRIGPEIKFRPTVSQHHAFHIEFHHNQIDPYVPENLNSEYFLNGQTNLKMIYLEYDFQMDKRKYTLYPNNGFMLFLNIKKEGLGIFKDVNNFNLAIGGEYYLAMNEAIVFGTRVKGKTNANRSRLAFANNTGLGWDQDIVSGYELYVMDGTDYFITKNKLTFKFFENNLRTVDSAPSQFQNVNISMFLRFNFDVAIVNERYYIDTNTLNNRWIYGYGPAFDIILFNNFLLSFEYSRNDIGEAGLYFHNKISF